MTGTTTEPLLRALARLRAVILDPDQLHRAVASGRQKGARPAWRRVDFRYVDLKAGRRLQITTYDQTQAHVANHEPGEESRRAVDALLDEPFGNWHVDSATESLQVRATKRLEAMVHAKPRSGPAEPTTAAHDRDKQRLLAEDDPVFRALGIADDSGRIHPTRRAKYRQVEEFVRLLDATVSEAIGNGRLRRPTEADPLRITDLGCGNAYLTFAAHRFLTGRGLPVALTGVDVKEQSREHNQRVAAQLGIDAAFVVGGISDAVVEPAPEVVLALHACDTATDDALARGIAWAAPLILAAPCCHHDIAAQLRANPTPAPYAMLTRHGIVRERFADTLTDALRASLLRLHGYKVDVVEFVESTHTPRNTLLRATATGSPVSGGRLRGEYDDLVRTWQLRPRLAELLHDAS